VLTSDGRKFLERAKKILLELNNLEMEFTSTDDEIKGSLVVGCQESLAWSLVPRALYKVRNLHPKLEIIVKPLWTSTSMDPLDKGEVDILLSFTMAPPTDKKYAHEFLCCPTFCAMMRKGHPLDNDGQNVRLKDLATFPTLDMKHSSTSDASSTASVA
jgi:DNA-binding transcriptional LysR family regulator